ncbi:alpha/beta fold hydrolase [Variovorax dokdonensis]|uniref:Alpha/beta fold hydrolase n=1 Tax=Variovorax dokdonensis TaxID=344883 RepID=A0ABT7NCV0_9BURK|nr:alpha/beta fold hydrolase [Variovorax dokdonensis]MDM0045742.1 alpha/beta fold hydrolase [Variovorax dokdonensis]
MAEAGVFLIHGLGGTQYDLGTLHKQLTSAGFITHSIVLPGHGTKPEDLIGVHAEDWLEAVCAKYDELSAQHEELHVVGMCMGALLAVEACKRQRHTKGRLIALAAPVFVDGWSVPWYRGLRYLMYRMPRLTDRWRVNEEEPYGIKNERLRAVVRAKFAKGDSFAYSWVPLACVREFDRLRRLVMKGLDSIECPALVIHAREDELTSLRSATFLFERIGAGRRTGQAQMVVLEDSYHLICVDNDKEIVARHVVDFLGASPCTAAVVREGATCSASARTLDMLERACALLQQGAFAALHQLGTADFAWYQPGRNRWSGVFRGSKGLSRLESTLAGRANFEGFGSPVFNAGVAIVRATLRLGGHESRGAIAFTVRRNRLVEARWFPDDPVRENALIGGDTPTDEAPPHARRPAALVQA